MTKQPLIPAAVYLRMSTEHQQYSLANQREAIRKYADENRFLIIKEYVDAARSGVVLRRRTGLKSLIQDAISGDANFAAILVYDVSRWGRFLNTDESAHYEFICTTAGVPVHYCFEQFANDGSTASLIMKSLKRAMAGEFSRDLGDKSYKGQKRLVGLGFKMGGQPGFGLRRLLVSKDGRKRFYLKHGQQKSLNTDRVILVRGPKEEVRWVQRIYRMALRKSSIQIVQYLNQRGVRDSDGGLWNLNRINGVLTNPKYTGQYVWGRVSVRLYTPKKRKGKEEWFYGPKTFKPIVSRAMFEKVQRARWSRFSKGNKLANEEVLKRVKKIMDEDGRLSHHRLRSEGMSMTLLYSRFKGLANVYRMIGHKMLPSRARSIEGKTKTVAARNRVVNDLTKMFPDSIQILRLGPYRPLLIVNKTITIGVQAGMKGHDNTGDYWKFYSLGRHEIGSMGLVCLLGTDNTCVEHYYLLRRMKALGQRLRLNNRALQIGIRLKDLSEVLPAINILKKNMHYSTDKTRVVPRSA